jgi:hypothetical protein
VVACCHIKRTARKYFLSYSGFKSRPSFSIILYIPVYIDIKRANLSEDLLVDVRFGERDLGKGVTFVALCVS